MKNFQLISFFLFPLLCSCQDYGELTKIQHLPSTMKEVSGIENFPGSKMLWMINDSGNKNILYGIRPGESELKPIEITNAENVDWEDLATDTSGNLYIGDFGNNANKRKDLAIYKLKDPENLNSEDAEVEKITFKLEDQTEFPPNRKNRNYDIEAFVHLNNNLYLFTKNRSRKSNGISKIYSVEDTPGNCTAKLVGEFQSCKNKACRITAATLSEDSKELLLLTNRSFYILRDFQGGDFNNAAVQHIEFDHNSQKESISFKDKNTLYIADEQNGSSGGNLYEFKLDRN